MKLLTPPKPSEYSPSAIQKAVISGGVKHPVTVYPIALGLSSGFVGWLFGIPALYIAALSGLFVGPFWAIAKIFFFHEKTGSQYIKNLNEKQKKYEEFLRQQVNEGLKECQSIVDMEDYARQGSLQFNNMQEKLVNIHELLDLKLSKSELTFGRFLGAAEQVSLSVLDNLTSMVSILKSLGSIQVDYINERLQEFSERNDITEVDIEQEKALKSRLELREAQIRKIKNLLTKNEVAMTEMEKISAAVAQWRSGGRFADIDFESAIVRLQELAEQAQEYDLQ